MDVLPGADKAVVSKEKLISYALNEEREPNKARAFKAALLDDGEYSTDTIRQSDILYVYADPSEPLRAI